MHACILRGREGVRVRVRAPQGSHRLSRVVDVLKVDKRRKRVRLFGQELDGGDDAVLAKVHLHVVLGRFRRDVAHE